MGKSASDGSLVPGAFRAGDPDLEGELEDLRNRVEDLEKVIVKFSRTERMIEQLRPLLRTMTQLMAQLVEAVKQLDVDEE